jgi:hypothetical protein
MKLLLALACAGACLAGHAAIAADPPPNPCADPHNAGVLIDWLEDAFQRGGADPRHHVVDLINITTIPGKPYFSCRATVMFNSAEEQRGTFSFHDGATGRMMVLWQPDKVGPPR